MIIVTVACFAQYDGSDAKNDPRIRYEYSRDEHNLPEQGDDTSGSDESYDDDFNSDMLQPKIKKNFIDENVDSAISRVKLEQDANSEYEELLDEKDLSKIDNTEESSDDDNDIEKNSLKNHSSKRDIQKKILDDMKNEENVQEDESKISHFEEDNSLNTGIKNDEILENKKIRDLNIADSKNISKKNDNFDNNDVIKNNVISEKLDKVLDKLDKVLDKKKYDSHSENTDCNIYMESTHDDEEDDYEYHHENT